MALSDQSSNIESLNCNELEDFLVKNNIKREYCQKLKGAVVAIYM